MSWNTKDAVGTENYDPYFLPDPTNFLTARPIEEIKEEITQRELLLSQLMEGQINRTLFCHHA